MTAIFAPYPEEIKCSPSKNFKIIRVLKDVRGYTFDSIIIIQGWYNSKNIGEAYEELKIRQPELFK